MIKRWLKEFQLLQEIIQFREYAEGTKDMYAICHERFEKSERKPVQLNNSAKKKY